MYTYSTTHHFVGGVTGIILCAESNELAVIIYLLRVHKNVKIYVIYVAHSTLFPIKAVTIICTH